MNTKLNTIAIDDQQQSLDVIINYAAQNPNVTLVKTCTDVFEAVELIKQSDIHLMFLDLNMNPVDGITFLRLLPEPPLTIIMTGYEQFLVQIDDFDLNPLDILLKPFSIQKFNLAIKRAQNELYNQNQSLSKPVSESFDYTFFKIDKQYMKSDHTDILYIEAKDYLILIHTTDQVIKPNVKENLAGIEKKQLLPMIGPEAPFFRIHRSYIINLDKIEAINGQCNSVVINSTTIPVGTTYREALAKRIGFNH
mgnify:CR=1 FL=1